MTNRISAYMKLVNLPRSSSMEEEIKIMDKIRTYLNGTPKLNKFEVMRYIRDTGSKKICVFETRRGDDIETAFILSELQKLYPEDVVFATPSERWTVNG